MCAHLWYAARMAYKFSPHEIALLEYLAYNVFNGILRSGARVRDAGDFKQWLLECAEAGTIQTVPSLKVG